MRVLCHGRPWEVGLKALKLYHHDVTIGNSMVPSGSCSVVSIEEWQHQASHVHAMGEQHSAVKPRAILLLPFVLLLLLLLFLLLLPQSARSRCLAQTPSWGDRSPLPGFLWD